MVKHGLLYVVGTIAPILVQLLVTPLVTRSLGDEQYGAVSLALVTSQTILVVCALGMNASITRQVVLEKGGADAGSKLVASGAVIVIAFASIAALVSLCFGGFSIANPWLLVAACYSGAGSALVQLAQALMRGLNQPIWFITVGAILAVVPPLLGLSAVYLESASAVTYFGTMATAQMAIGLLVVAGSIRRHPGFAAKPALLRAIGIGLPTVPHVAASSLLLTLAVFVASAAGGDVLAGRVQIAALLGTAPNTLISAVNNAWAPSVYRTPANTRARMLKRTTAQVALLALVATAGYSAVGPLLLPIIAGPVANPQVMILSLLLASTTALFVMYLANIHFTFISGRTWPLAITSPLSTLSSILVLLVVTHQSQSMLVFSSAWFCYFSLQAGFSYLLARWSREGAASFAIAYVPLILCFSLPVAATFLLSSTTSRIGISLAAVCVGSAFVHWRLKAAN